MMVAESPQIGMPSLEVHVPRLEQQEELIAYDRKSRTQPEIHGPLRAGDFPHSMHSREPLRECQLRTRVSFHTPRNTQLCDTNRRVGHLLL